MAINVFPAPSKGGAASNDFTLNVGSSGNTTYVLGATYPAGRYVLNFVNGDTTYDIYFIAENGTNAGYTKTTAANVSEPFSEVVVLGATGNETITFDYDGALTSPSSLGDVSTAGAYITGASVLYLPNANDTTVISGGNFASDVEVFFIGSDAVEKAAKSITRNSSTSLTVTRPDAMTSGSNTVKVVNPGIALPTGTNAHIATDLVSTVLTVTGGTTYTSGGYKYHKFTANGTLYSNAALSAEILAVAGGGGSPDTVAGVFTRTGGAGAGGLLYSSTSLLQGSNSVVIGAGGTRNANGSNTSIYALTAIGGGRPGQSGGSGGGGGGSPSTLSPGAGTSGQGFAGGTGGGGDGGAGGGGASAAGGNGSATGFGYAIGGAGGAGSSAYSTWASATSSGASGAFAGGGGGGSWDSTSNVALADGGVGGGGFGARDNTPNSGTANTGGGGGGSGCNIYNAPSGRPGSNGGSGIVIVRYAI